MRVISGIARHIALKTVEGLATRPTTDRIKETLFNMLQTKIPGCVFIDCFSGSGAIGIEALSRGAKESYFIDNNPKAITCIHKNLEKTKLANKATVISKDVVTALKSLHHKKILSDIIFLDPPYDLGIEESVLLTLATCDYVDEQTLIIIEAALETSFDYVESIGYHIIKSKNYKTNKHVFLERSSECI